MGRPAGFKFKKTEKKLCDQCGKEFMHSKVYIQKPKYCSRKCNQVAWALRQIKSAKPNPPSELLK